MPTRCVIVGASLAGIAAVEAIRERDADAEVVLVGDEPHLPYDRPPLSKEVLQGAKDAAELRLRDDGWAGQLRVEVRTGTRATRVDTVARTVTLADGQQLAYDRLLLATGAAPRMLPGLAGIAGVHVLRTLDDALAVRDAIASGGRLAVVGGGFIGLEVAASARQRGAEVTVIETLGSVLARAVGVEVGEAIGQLHQRHGVELRTGVAVQGPLLEEGRLVGLLLSDGTTVEADTVVVGIGVEPTTDWIGDPAIEVDDGVLVDAQLRTAVPEVFAAGDVARVAAPDGTTHRVEHWATAIEHGRAAGRNMVSAPDEHEPLDGVPSFWSDQYDAKIRAAGTIVDPERVEVLEVQQEPFKLVALATDADDVLTGIITVGRASALARCRPLFGQPDSGHQARALLTD